MLCTIVLTQSRVHTKAKCGTPSMVPSLMVLIPYRGQSGTLLSPPPDRFVTRATQTSSARHNSIVSRAHKSERARHNLKIARDTNLNARATTRKSRARHNSGDPVAGPAARFRSSPDAHLRPLPCHCRYHCPLPHL